MTLVLFSAITALFSCNHSKMATTNSKINFDKQGHRGCRGLMPENTIPAMLKALELGVTTLEMDISFSADKKALLSHEPFFNHEITTKPDGSFITEAEEKNYNLYKMNYDSIVKYDVGIKPHPRFAQQEKTKAIKPLLSDLFVAVKEYMKTSKRPFPFFNIETKTQPATDNIFHPAPEEFVELLMSEIKKAQLEPFIIIQSFDVRTLQYLHKNYPNINTAILIDEGNKKSIGDFVTELGYMPPIFSPHFSMVTKVAIEALHSHKKKIIPWTVNDKAEIERLKSMGVDGIITDYPNLFNE